MIFSRPALLHQQVSHWMFMSNKFKSSIFNQFKFKSDTCNIPHGLVVRITGSHPVGPGPIPGMEISLSFKLFVKKITETLQRLQSTRLDPMFQSKFAFNNFIEDKFLSKLSSPAPQIPPNRFQREKWINSPDYAFITKPPWGCAIKHIFQRDLKFLFLLIMLHK